MLRKCLREGIGANRLAPPFVAGAEPKTPGRSRFRVAFGMLVSHGDAPYEHLPFFGEVRCLFLVRVLKT